MSTSPPATEPTAERPPPPRALTLTLAVLTVVGVGVVGLLPFLDELRGPGEDAAVAPAPVATTDDFDRTDADGLATNGAAWEEVAGTWAVLDGHAALTAAADDAGDAPAALAVLPAEAGTVARVTATAVEPGWAFAFRVVDARNHWRLVVAPDGATWSLELVVDGRVTTVPGAPGVVPADGDRIEVRLAGRVTATVDGVVVAEADDNTHAEATAVGLAALTPDSVVSMAWDDVGIALS